MQRLDSDLDTRSGKFGLFSPTISAKICLFFLGLLVVACTNILVARSLLRDLNGVAETVNVAGRLRMLSQRIAYQRIELLYRPRAGDAALEKSIADYDTALAALLAGGQAFGYPLRPPTPALRAELAALQTVWLRSRAWPDAGAAEAAAQRIARDQAEQLAGAERVVLALTDEARQAQAGALAHMYALLALDVLLLALMFVRMRRRIVAPLKLLARHSLALSRGDYRARVAVGAHDEIGQLAAAFNHSAQRIGELVEKLERDRQGTLQAELTFRGLADNSVVGVYIVQDGRFRFVNPKMAAMFGHQREQMIASVSLFDLVLDDERALVEYNIERRISGEVREVHYERRARRKDGSTFDVEVYGSSMELDGAPATIGIILDVTERKRAERAMRLQTARSEALIRQLEYSANYDALTGLANRNLLGDRLRLAMASAARQGRLVGILLHDLDNFKIINDSLGHDAGDSLLKAVAQRMRAVVREGDTVARLGGDEFVLVIPDMGSAEEIMAVANKLLAELAKPYTVDQQQVYVSASIGVSLYPRDGERQQVLLKNADLALYRAKREGRNTVRFFTEQLNAHNRERQTLETALHHALEHEQFELHYQPKYDQASGAMTGVEALVRWNHPQRGQIGPGAFIALAEETGLIVPLGSWVLRTACRQARAWQDAGYVPLTMAVNLSARQLVKDELLRIVDAALRDSGLDAAWLELELTETAIMRDALEAITILNDLKGLGVRLALDDFGTGYSSLSYLRRFPLDTVKIDRSFIMGVGDSAHDRAIVKTIIALAANLGMDAIAEGVETPFQLQFLRQQGCHAMQGFLFSRPLPPAELAPLLAQGAAMQVA